MEERRVLQNDVEKIVEDIIKLCSINSVEGEGKEGMPFGEGPAKALQCALKLGEDMGFISENFDNYAGHIDFGEGEETLGILCHADVVPCGEDWICDPYNPQIIDGRLYGRGVLDNKGPMVVCLHAMRILKEMNIPLKKKVRLIIGTFPCADTDAGVQRCDRGYESGTGSGRRLHICPHDAKLCCFWSTASGSGECDA